jgi:predicted ferric reductase/Ca2+-binding EF-hand superfamily protein
MTAPPTSARADARLLAALEAAFTRHAGGDDRIDAADLQRALGLRSEYLARRVLARFDANGDGVISRAEFLTGVRALIAGNEREKLGFVFALHDGDGDGFLGPQDVHRMVAMSLAESEVEGRVSQPPDGLALGLLIAADRDRDGRVSFDEFAAAVRARPDLLRRMTRSEALWIAPSEDLLARLESPAGGGGRVHEVLRAARNQASSVVVLALWVLANVAVLTVGLRPDVRAPMPTDLALRWTHATALAIDLNAALILVPVLRRLLTRVRASWFGHFVPVDGAIDFHRVVGHGLAALSVVHVAAVGFAYAMGHPHGTLGAFVYGTRLGATGAALVGVFAVMWALSLDFIRRTRRFELFFFSHALYALWFALAFLHAPSLLRWVAVALVGFCVEQLLRVRRSGQPTEVTSFEALRSGVVRLDLRRPPGFAYHPGDYVFLRIPAVAEHEWHPFTLSSAPERDDLSVHVRALGNWTAALRERIERMEAGDLPPTLAVHIDGPYGSPTAHLFRAKHAVLIGAGIGVTPFASVLGSLVARAEAGAELTLRKGYFIWLNRDQYSFEWFVDLLADVERRDRGGLLDIQLYMTGGRAGATAMGLELARAVQAEQGRRDLVTGLRAHTHMGHPDWDAVFTQIARTHAPDVVEVFFCGPPGLGAKVRRACERHGMTFREEVF